jgi:hydroxypyruvate isomerase
MPRFSANLTTMFRELPFLDRFSLAAAQGFEAVEVQFPYEWDPNEINARLKDAGATLVLLNAPPGDWAAGDRGLAGIPGREEEFRASIETAMRYAAILGAPLVHVMAGTQSKGASRELYVENLRWAAGQLAAIGVTAVIEAINRHDMPGYLVNLQSETAAVAAEVGAPNLRMQMDCYHMGRMGEEIEAQLKLYRAQCAHVQIADCPGRHEPGTGDLNFTSIFSTLDAIGYAGWVGCEYNPRGETVEGLAWRKRLAQSSSAS